MVAPEGASAWRQTGVASGMGRNLMWGFLHHGVGRAAMFVFFLLLPLLIPIDAVGRFTLVYTSLLLALQPVVEFSLGLIVTKYAAKGRPEMVQAVFRTVLRGLPAVLAAAFLVALVSPLPRVVTGLLLVSVGLTLVQGLVFAYLRGRQRMRLEGVVGGVQGFAALVALLALSKAGLGGPELPAAALVAMAATGWLLMVVLFPGELAALRAELRDAGTGSRPPWWPLLREGLALGGVGFVGLLYLRIDVLMLGAMKGAGEVGFYFTASKWIETTFVVPSVLMLVFMPHLVKSQAPARPLLRMALLLGVLGVGAAAAAVALSWWVVPLVYGADGAPIQWMMRALAPAIAAVYLGHLFTQALVVLDLHRRYLQIALAGLAVNLGCNAALIPVLGGVGAGVATVVTELVVTAGAAVVVRRRLSSAA